MQTVACYPCCITLFITFDHLFKTSFFIVSCPWSHYIGCFSVSLYNQTKWLKFFNYLFYNVINVSKRKKNIHQNLVNSNSLGLEALFRINSSSNYREVDVNI